MRRWSRPEEGIALVLVLLIIVILYVVTTQVVYTSRLEDFSSRNEAILARMDLAMDQALKSAFQALKDDLAQGGAEGAGPGGAGPALPGGAGGLPAKGPAGAPGGGGPGGEQEGGEPCDSKNDEWVHPETYVDKEISVYTYVVDENRKFNLLSILSPDQDFARESMERLVRLLDLFREDTDWDLSRGDAEMIAEEIKDYMQGLTRPEEFGSPEQISDQEGETTKLPKSLDELLVLPHVDANLLYDQIRGDQFYPGLSSVLTVWTSQTFPELPQPEGLRGRVQAVPGALGKKGGAGSSKAPPGKGGAKGGKAGGEEGAGNKEAEGEPLGVGIRINVNTAPRAVLKCLLPDAVLPAQVIEAILEYRNEEVPQDETAPQGETGAGGGDSLASLEQDLLGNTKTKTRVFSTLDDLDKVDEFKNWMDEEAKKKFLSLLTTKSDVFTIHLAATVKINEEKHVVYVRRARCVVRREESGESQDAQIFVILPFEERGEQLVVDYPDFPDLERERMQSMEFTGEFADLTAEDLYWNPFRFEFYVPQEERLNWRPGEK